MILKSIKNTSGLSIVATVMIMMILALFAAAAVSLVTTSTGTGIQEERGVEAFYIADGGMQYTLKKNTYPYYAVSSSETLGNGSFTVFVPTTSGITIGETGTLNVSSSSTDGFVMSKNNVPSDPTDRYWVVMCAVASPTEIRASSDCEKISATNKTSSSFTTLTRGRDSTVAAAHPSTAVVMMYIWDDTKTTTLSDKFQVGAKCKGASKKICVNDSPSFASFAASGFIRIYNATENNTEDVFYDGKGNDPSVCGGCAKCLGTNGCSRKAFDGGGNGTVEHASGATIYQSEFSVLPTSTGVIPNTILTNIQRVVQGNIMPLQDP